MNSIEPTYFVKHPDGSYSEAEPQPKRYFYENNKVSYLINHLTSAVIHAQRASEIPRVEAVDFYMQSVNALRQQQSKIQELEAEVESMKSGGEPVAWMTEWKYKGVTCREVTFEIQQRGSTAIHTQLFTRPAKYLQDEDLEECHKAAWRIADDATGYHQSYSKEFQLIYQRNFAKAALKKAGEK